MLFNNNEFYHRPEFYGGYDDGDYGYDYDHEEDIEGIDKPLIIGSFDVELADDGSDLENEIKEGSGFSFYSEEHHNYDKEGNDNYTVKQKKEEEKEDGTEVIDIFEQTPEKEHTEHIEKTREKKIINTTDKEGDTVHTIHRELDADDNIISEKEHEEKHHKTDTIDIYEKDENGEEHRETKVEPIKGQGEIDIFDRSEFTDKKKKYKNLLNTLREKRN